MQTRLSGRGRLHRLVIYPVLAFTLAVTQPLMVFAAEDTTSSQTPTTSETSTAPAATEPTTTPQSSPSTETQSTSAPTTTASPEPATSSTTQETTPPPTPPASSSTTSEAPPPKTPGPTSPTGADAKTYTYNPETGMWENGVYAWNPTTKQTQPLYEQTYSYNPETGMWDTTEWVYDAPSGKYVENKKILPAAPTQQQLIESGLSPETARQTLAQAASGNPVSTARTAATPASSPQIGSKNSFESSSTGKGTFDLFYNASISNTLESLAKTGEALVSGNTLAGSALSGDATAIANLVNLLQSSWGIASGGLLTFLSNITGDVVGDLLFDPEAIPANTSIERTTDVDVNVTQNGSITNDVDLDAISGNATVSENTKAGDATSGNAYAMANIVNAINTAIASDTSFLGMINIFGNLNGDILLPQNLLNALLASNGSTTLDQTTNLDVDATSTQSIANNVTATAGSGNATVDNNTKAGSATTGDAETNVTLLNLTGRQIIGERALLVFVNVLGSWIGMIMDAPQGTNSAALGGGISQNQTKLTSTTDASLDIDETNRIVNNVDVNAQSGDATVTTNTEAGNATSGNAKAGVNIANIIESDLALTDWFGILFINVLGSWNGSFGVNTEAGTLPKVTPAPAGSGGQTAVERAADPSQFVSFAPNKSATGPARSGRTQASSTAASSATAASGGQVASAVTADMSGSDSYQATAAGSTASSSSPSRSLPLWQLIGVGIGLSLLATERALHYRDRRRMNL